MERRNKSTFYLLQLSSIFHHPSSKFKNMKNNKAVALQISVPQSDKKTSSGEPKVIAFDEGILPQMRTQTSLDGVRQKVFMDRYSLKDAKGEATEFTPEEMWQRVAAGIAQMERTHALRKLWAQKFYDAMEGFKFVPAGRILSGAGTGYEVTFFNCYVIPSPKDSRQGIMENITHTVEIQARGGGVGINLSSLRPHGARVKKVNGTSSGPVSWAKLYSAANHDVIQQGGSRRGALMLMLHDWHPDVIEFIHAKEDGISIPGANLSVCISDKFMEALQNDEDWITKFPDTSDPEYDEKWDGVMENWEEIGGKVIEYKTYKAREIWDQICTSAWKSAEPGLHFLERSNKWGNTWYFEKLLSTNPCTIGQTWIHTSEGPKQVKDLIGKPFVARVNGQNHLSGPEGFFKTGTKGVLKLETVEGYSLKLTDNHLVKRLSQEGITEWIEAGKLQEGDQILLNNHRQNIEWKGDYTYKEGYLTGLLVGDGTLKSDKAVLSVWDTAVKNGSAMYFADGPRDVMANAQGYAMSMPHRSDFTGWMALPNRNEYRMALGHIKTLAHKLGMTPGNKTITDEIEKTSSDFYKGFLRGFFDADGSVQATTQSRINVRLAQSNLVCLQAAQRMLLRLGITSRIYQNRRVAGVKLLPDGKGGHKEYPVKAQHELVISRDNLDIFNEIIGFANGDKSELLKGLLKTHNKVGRWKEKFFATVKNLEFEGKADVYDVQIPGINYFDANGIIAHNCGEQPLGAWAVCNLGAMNLSAFVKDDGAFDYEDLEDKVRVAMRFMDNVVDANYYFWKENEIKAKEIRRTGIGTMGLGDALIKMKLRYGSEEAQPVIERIYQTIRDASYDTSADLAKEKGSFPKFDDVKYMQGHFIKQLPVKIQSKIKTQGIRNAVILTQAPTGTTSLLAGVSSGIEPVFDFKFIRKDRIGEHVIYHPLFQKWLEENPGAERPSYFAGANDMSPLDHVKVQALIQNYTDSSISKTANAPHDFTVEQVKELYMEAYKLGCKGVTFFRDGSRSGVLYHADEKKEEKKEEADVSPSQDTVISRPMILRGRTYKMQTPVGEGFITINRDEKNQPFEVFITVGKGGMHTMADAEAMGRLVSLSLRLARNASNVDPKTVAQKIAAQLRGIGGASHVGFGKDRVMSLADAIAKALAEDMAINEAGSEEQAVEALPLNLTESEEVNAGADDVVAGQVPLSATSSSDKTADLCPECGQASFVFEEGCKKCYSCGYSMC